MIKYWTIGRKDLKIHDVMSTLENSRRSREFSKLWMITRNFRIFSIKLFSIGITHLHFFRGIIAQVLPEIAHVEYRKILDMAMTRIVKAKF